MPVPTPPITDNDFENPDGQLIIQLGGYDGASANATVTRSPILDDGSNFYYDLTKTFTGTANTLGIYALTDTPSEWSTNTTNFEESGALLNNIRAIATQNKIGEADGANVTGADELNKISLIKPDIKTATNTDFGGVYYYPMLSKKNYTFYGYAPYQENEEVTATKSTITIKGEKKTIDGQENTDLRGSEDIMFCKAVAPTITTGSIYINSALELNPAALNGYNAKYIRQLKYHKELNTSADKTNYPWVPNLKFEHQMVWLKFSVVAAKAQSKEDKKNAHDKLTVSDITLLNQPTSATIDIKNFGVTKDYMTFEGSQSLKMLAATKVDGSYTFTDAEPTTAQNSYAPEYNCTGSDQNSWSDVDNPTIVGYLLVKPADTYDLQLTVTPKATDSGVQPAKQTFTITVTNPNKDAADATAFAKGKSYNVRLGIYALQEVEATAQLTEWGNDVVIDIPVE